MAEPSRQPIRKSTVTARMVCPALPTDPDSKKELEADLMCIGCVGLLARPWNLKNDDMVQELIHGVPNQFELTVRGRPLAWTEDIWSEVYNFKKSGNGLASRSDKYVTGKFRSPAHSKEGFAISDCKNERHRRMLEFLIPIMYPEKPTRVTVTVANTIFGALEDRAVHWGKVISGVVAKLADHVSKAKQSPISPYLYHLYQHQEVLNTQESIEYRTGEELLKYDLTNKVREEPAESGGGEQPEPEEEVTERRRRKSTDPGSRGKAPAKEQGGPSQIPDPEKEPDFFDNGFLWMGMAKKMYDNLVGAVISIAKELKVEPDKILEEIRRRPSPEQLQEKEEQLRKMEAELYHLKPQMAYTEQELKVSRQREVDALRLVHSLKERIEIPEHAVIRSNLYSTWLETQGTMTGSKMVTILVDFEARMKMILKEMNKLLGFLDPDRALDMTEFPEVLVNLFRQTPVKETPSRQTSGVRSQSQPVGLQAVLTPPGSTAETQETGWR